MQHITRRELLPLAFAGAALPEIERTVLNDRGMTFLQRCARTQIGGYHGWDEAFTDPAAPEVQRIKVEHARAGTLKAERAELEQIVKPIWNGLSDMDRSFLIAMIQDDRGSSIRDIARRLGRSTNYAQHYRYRLINAGVISPAGRGKIRFVHSCTRDWLSTLGYDIED